MNEPEQLHAPVLQDAAVRSSWRSWPGPVLLILVGLFAMGLVLGLVQRQWQDSDRWSLSDSGPRPSPEVVWMFEPAARGGVLSSPCVAGDRVYLGIVHDAGLAPRGAVYCLDLRTGVKRWEFDDDGRMRPLYSSPCVADGRVYVGEGMHAHPICNLYCLDAATGRKLWHFEAAGHIESSPCVANGFVYFGAGDDGLFALDAVTGKERWHFRGAHVDANPIVAAGRVYAGSGVSRALPMPEILCLDAQKGEVVWRHRTELPVWGSPVLDGGQVFFGLGNGRLTRSADPPEKPAGSLLCVDTQTGHERWRFRTSDAVFVRPTVDANRVFFGARDEFCYCLERRDGRVCWKNNLGSPVVTTPALLDGRLYVVANGGLVRCLDAESGNEHWSFDVADHTRSTPLLVSSPTALYDKSVGRRLIFGTDLRTSVSNAAVVYCLGD